MEQLFFLLKSFILGIVEGITEFLPVSSTGHLIIFQNLLHFTSESENYIEMYTYVIQLGAILAIVILYREKIWETLVHLFPQKGKVEFKESGLSFWLLIALACVPGLIVELGLGDLAEKYLFNTVSVSLALFFGGILMIFMEKKFRKNHFRRKLAVSPKQAIIIGCFQCLAVIPGMSRSASTIMGGWVAGLTTVHATEFSFFLAIPVMVGMSFLKILKIGGFGGMSSTELISLAIGFVVSFVVALFVVDRFIAYLKTKPMRVFAYYRMIFAVIVLIMGFAGIFHAV